MGEVLSCLSGCWDADEIVADIREPNRERHRFEAQQGREDTRQSTFSPRAQQAYYAYKNKQTDVNRAKQASDIATKSRNVPLPEKIYAANRWVAEATVYVS